MRRFVAYTATLFGLVLGVHALSATEPEHTAVIVADGDSLTAGSGLPAGQDYPRGIGDMHPEWAVHNSGQAWLTCAEVAAGIDDVTVWFEEGKPNVVVLWCGYNDYDGQLQGWPVNAIYHTTRDYALDLRAAGAKVVLISSTIPNPWPHRTQLNDLYRQTWPQWADGFVDLDKDARLADWHNTLYFAGDDVHLTAAGYAIVATHVESELARLIPGPLIPIPTRQPTPTSAATATVTPTVTATTDPNATPSATATEDDLALTDSLVSHWKLEEDAFVNRDDAHASNDLAPGATPKRTGKIGDASDIDSNGILGNYLTIAATAPFAIASGASGTAACWINLDAMPAAVSYPMARWGATGDWAMNVAADGTAAMTVARTAGNDSAMTPSSTISTGNWYFIVGWYDHTVGTHGTVYVQVNNGTIYSQALTAAKVTANNGFFVGSLGVAFGSMDGAVDSASFWSRVLTDGERTSLYNAGAGLDYPMTVAAYGLPVMVAYHEQQFGAGQ